MSKLKIEVFRLIDQTGVGMSIYEVHGREIYLAKPMKLELEKIDPLAAHKPTLILPAPFHEEFFQAMAEEAKRRGLQPKAMSFIEGELKATKHHLNDMRNLVFKGRK